MARPATGSYADQLYETLEPLAYEDEALGWPLLHYCEAIGKMFQEIEDYVRDKDAGPGWSLFVDVNRVPDVGLAWLGQLVGISIPARGRIVTVRNLMENPSAEVDAAGMVSLANATIVRSSAFAKFGSFGFAVTAPAAGNSDVQLRQLDTTAFAGVVGENHTVSLYGRNAVAKTLEIRIEWRDELGAVIQTDVSGALQIDATFPRVSFTRVAPSNAVQFFVIVRLLNPGAGDISYFDGIQIERAAAASTYTDGTQTDCRWVGAAHASESERLGEETVAAYSARMRALISGTSSWKRGTPAAIRTAVQRWLTGNKTVVIRERDGSPYALKVITYNIETPDAVNAERAAKSQKPAGLVLTYESRPGQDYNDAAAAHATYNAAAAAYPDYNSAMLNIP